MNTNDENPSGWVECGISDLVSYDGVFKDGDWVESKDQDPKGDVRLIQLADIGDGSFLDKSSRFLTAQKASDLNCTFLERGDFLVARMPDPLGRCCIFPMSGIKKYVTVVDVCVIRLASSPVDRKYFLHLINSPFVREKISALQSGSTRKRISRKNLSAIRFLLAPINEQKRIAAKIEELFSELDKGIESLKTARDQLKVYRQAVLKHAFEGKLTARWREKNKDKLETPEQILERIEKQRESVYRQQLAEWKAALASPEGNGAIKKPSKPKQPAKISLLPKDVLENLPRLPEGWVWHRVGDLCEVVRGGSPRPAGDKRYYDGSIPFLKVADLTRNPGSYLRTYSYTIKEAGLTKTRYVESNTLMISNSGATLGVPKICLIGATFNDGIAAFLGLDSSSLLYHYYFWESKTETLRAINQGAAQPNLNTDLFEDVLTPVCSSAEMEAVSIEVERSLSICDQIMSEIDNGIAQSEILRQSILKKAFSGRLVPQDPNDEPASVLLERIRAEKAAQAETNKPKGKRQPRRKRAEPA